MLNRTKIILVLSLAVGSIFLLYSGRHSFKSDSSKPENYFSISDYNFDSINDLFKTVEASDSPKSLVFNSSGGNTSLALFFGKQLAHVDLIVNYECLSNCAELILPAAKSITFEDKPLIGFHGNILSYEHFVKRLQPVGLENCDWVYARKSEELLDKKHISVDFWIEQMNRLKPNVTFEYKASACPKRHYNFENRMWFPTGEQLSDLLGLKFNGRVCADDIRSCRKRIDKRWAKGTRVVIGDEVYVSKGY